MREPSNCWTEVRPRGVSGAIPMVVPLCSYTARPARGFSGPVPSSTSNAPACWRWIVPGTASTLRAIPTLAAVADMVGAIADECGLDRFPVVGFSGGGPFALACGVFLPERVSWVAMVSSWGPLDEREAAFASLTPTERELVSTIRADPAGATALLWESGAWYAESPLAISRDSTRSRRRAHLA